jgi:Invasin, domain 3
MTISSLSFRGNARTGALLSVVCLLTLMLWVGCARAAVTVESFSLDVSDPYAGVPDTQAGAHADLDVSLSFEDPGEPETVKNLDVSAPPGVFVYPEATPRCGAADFGEFECTSNSQVGLVTVAANYEGDSNSLLGTAPVYLLVPGPGQIARLGFVVPALDIPVTIPISVRAGAGYGLDFSVQGFTQAAALAGLDLTLWAVPADPSHDSQRFARGSPAEPAGCPGVEGTGCIISGGTPSNASESPLLRNPTACTGPLTSTLEADSYQDPDNFYTATFAGPGVIGCNHLAFGPGLTAGLTTNEARTTSGLDLDIAVATEGATNPRGFSESDTKSIAVTLPPGLGVNQSAVETQGACSESEFESLGAGGPSGCADSSRIGTFTAGILGLEAPLEGSIYFGGSELPGVYRLFLSASGPAVNAKFVGLLQLDPETGQSNITFSNLPQFPFDDLDLEIASGPGLFLTPLECGSYEIRGVLTPWSSPLESYVVTDAVTLDSGPDGGPCPGPAEKVVVSLAPPSILANGSSASTATATVTDANGYGISGDEVAFLSSDPGEQIGTVTDDGNGSYTAQITSSITPGAAVITAIDESVEPEALGTATLLQFLGEHPASAPPPSPDTTPPDTRVLKSVLKRKPPIWIFRFGSSDPSATFRCGFDGHPLTACASPQTYKHPKPGLNTFTVLAVDAAGNEDPTPALTRFVVPKQSKHERGHRRAGIQ